MPRAIRRLVALEPAAATCSKVASTSSRSSTKRDLDALGVGDQVALAARAQHDGLRSAQLPQLCAQSTRHKKQRDQRHPSGCQRCDAGGRCEVIGHAGRISPPREAKTSPRRSSAAYSVKATWYRARLLSLVPSPGTGAISTVTLLTPCVSGFSLIGMLTVSSWPAAIRGMVCSTLMSLAVRDRDGDGHVGLLRLALVLDRHVERHPIRHGHAVHAAVGQLRPGRLRGHALEARCRAAPALQPGPTRPRCGRAASRTVSGSSQPRSGRNRSVGNRSSMPLLLVGGRQLGDRALEVDHVAGEQCLHLARDRVDRVAGCPRSSPSAAGSCAAMLLDRVRAELERLDQPAVRARSARRDGRCRVRARTSCSASARSAFTWVWTSSASERWGGRAGRRAGREISLEPPHERTHVRGVVLEGAVLAAVQAAVDPDHEQDHDDHGGAQAGRAAEHQCLAVDRFAGTSRPSVSGRAACLA